VNNLNVAKLDDKILIAYKNGDTAYKIDESETISATVIDYKYCIGMCLKLSSLSVTTPTVMATVPDVAKTPLPYLELVKF